MPTKAEETKARKQLETRIPPNWMRPYRDDEDDPGNYVCRSFNGHKDVEILRYARSTRQNVLIAGETGPGKTSSVYAYAAEDKLPVVNISCHGAVDPSTMWVMPVWNSDGSVTVQESEALMVVRYGGVLYLDEVNFLPPRIAAVLHGALDIRRVVTIPELGNEAIQLHPDCQVIGTYNPDYEGTKPLNEAFKNRFFIQLEYEYDRAIEEKLVVGIPTLIDLAEQLRVAKEQGVIGTPVGPNALMEFEQIAEDLSVEFAIENFLRRFAPDERSPVRNAIDLLRDQIMYEAEEMKKGDTRR